MVMAGSLDRQITIEQATPAPDAGGQPIDSWGTFATVWARRTDITGKERHTAERPVAFRSATYRIRWLTGIDETMRVVDADDEATYEIKGIAGDRRKGWLELACEAVDPAATVS